MEAADVVKLRAALRWTQDELAEFLGVNRSSVSRYETGLSVPGPVAKHLQKLADDLAKGRRRPKPGRRPRRRRQQSEAVAAVG